MCCLHIPNAVISILQFCRSNKRTDNFSQRAKNISVAIHLRIFLLSHQIIATLIFSSKKYVRILSHPSDEFKSTPQKISLRHSTAGAQRPAPQANQSAVRAVPCVRCQSACAAHRPNGTCARNAPFRIAPAPLRNREIAFGGGRFPVRRISHRCVPRGPLRSLRFARALDCFAICAAPLRKLRFLRRIAGEVDRAVGTGALRFSARLHSATANPPSSARGNPSAATARLAWSRCLPAPIASVPAASCPSRRRIRSGPVAGTPRPLRAIGTCPFLRGAFRAP